MSGRQVLFIVVSVTLITIGCTPEVMKQDNAAAQDSVGNLKITFKYQGDVPESREIDVRHDAQYCLQNGPLLDRSLIVNKANKGIKNVVVYAYTSRRGGMKLPAQRPANRNHVLATKQCQYEPRVTLTQVGDTIEVVNQDDIGHNANFIFLSITPSGFQRPPGQPFKIKIQAPEPTVASVQCNIHPWMKAYVLAVDHPFFGVTDENGEVTIEGLPSGKVILRAWHENGTFSKQIIVNGHETKWSKNVFEFNLKTGDNDYGTVEVPADQFRINQ